jgi:hypothetical protein
MFAITYEDVVGNGGSQTLTLNATQESNIKTLVSLVNQLISDAGLSRRTVTNNGGFSNSSIHDKRLHPEGIFVDLWGDKENQMM